MRIQGWVVFVRVAVIDQKVQSKETASSLEATLCETFKKHNYL